jgi:hypothetical protein
MVDREEILDDDGEGEEDDLSEEGKESKRCCFISLEYKSLPVLPN